MGCSFRFFELLGAYERIKRADERKDFREKDSFRETDIESPILSPRGSGSSIAFEGGLGGTAKRASKQERTAAVWVDLGQFA